MSTTKPSKRLILRIHGDDGGPDYFIVDLTPELAGEIKRRRDRLSILFTDTAFYAAEFFLHTGWATDAARLEGIDNDGLPPEIMRAFESGEWCVTDDARVLALDEEGDPEPGSFRTDCQTVKLKDDGVIFCFKLKYDPSGREYEGGVVDYDTLLRSGF